MTSNSLLPLSCNINQKSHKPKKCFSLLPDRIASTAEVGDLLPILIIVLINGTVAVGVVGGAEVGDGTARDAQDPEDREQHAGDTPSTGRSEQDYHQTCSTPAEEREEGAPSNMLHLHVSCTCGLTHI